jgi:hypothetical protein
VAAAHFRESSAKELLTRCVLTCWGFVPTSVTIAAENVISALGEGRINLPSSLRTLPNLHLFNLDSRASDGGTPATSNPEYLRFVIRAIRSFVSTDDMEGVEDCDPLLGDKRVKASKDIFLLHPYC